MSIQHIIHGNVKKPQAAEQLKQLLTESEQITGTLLFGWSVGPGKDQAFTVDAVLISDKGQVTAIDLAEGPSPGALGDYHNRQDQAFCIVESQLRSDRNLMDGRKLKIKVQTITFSPESDLTDPEHPEHPLANNNLVGKLLQFQDAPPDDVDPDKVMDAVLWTP